MVKKGVLILTLVLFFWLVNTNNLFLASKTNNFFNHIENSHQILIKYKEGISEEERSAFEIARGLRFKKYLRVIDAYVYEYMNDVLNLVISLKENPFIELAEIDFKVRIAEKLPNDPLFVKQLASFDISNLGRQELNHQSAIYLPEIWNVSTGSPNLIVAVIDTGVDYHHEDLQENIWINKDEIPNNGLDDDKNGYIDDYYGINSIDSTGDPWDDHGHGTHCAGIIGAVGNNKIGVCGICWKVQLMGLKCLNKEGIGYISDAIECIQYAVENGAEIINLPWGTYYYSEFLKRALETYKDKKIIFVVPAGNDGLNIDLFPFYPACYEIENILTIGALNISKNLLVNSNYGITLVDFFMPGESVLSTVPENSYSYKSGTSMASSYGSGVLALSYILFKQNYLKNNIQKILENINLSFINLFLPKYILDNYQQFDVRNKEGSKLTENYLDQSIAKENIYIKYANTSSIDWEADAPWRVTYQYNVRIPIFVYIKDADGDPIYLKSIKIFNNKNNMVVDWYIPSGNGLLIDESPFIRIFEIYASNFNCYSIGDVADILVKVNFERINYSEEVTYSQRLKVFIGEPLPGLENWYPGDTHFHSDFTDNQFEWGAGLLTGPYYNSNELILKKVGKAIGLKWVTVTDHSCDFGDDNDILPSSVTDAENQWISMARLCENNSVNNEFIILPAEEVTLGDIPNNDRIHLLVYNAYEYINGPEIFASDHYALSLVNIKDSFNEIRLANRSKAFCYAAHPLDEKDYFVGTFMAKWNQETYSYCLLDNFFRGLELWNTRITKKINIDYEHKDPFSWQYDPNWDNKLKEGINLWNSLLIQNLYSQFSNNKLRKIFIEGGSDAHGDFNYATYRWSTVTPDIRAKDNALGKVRTYVYSENGFTRDKIHSSLENGHSVVSDGPLVIFGIDKNGDGKLIKSDNDVIIGDDCSLFLGSDNYFIIKFKSNQYYSDYQDGRIDVIKLVFGGYDFNNDTPVDIQVNSLAGEKIVKIPQPNSAGWTFYRIEAYVKDNNGNIMYRAYTNPIWINWTEPRPFVLSNPRVSPVSGTTSSYFTFRVDYYDPDGDEPTVKQIILDGNTYNVTLESGAASNGTYSYGPIKLEEGQHSFYFHFENGIDSSVDTELHNGPYVYEEGGPGTYILTIKADPNPVQVNSCTVVTATLKDSLGRPVEGKELTFQTDFPPGIFSGAPPTGCSGPTYGTGNSGITDANGEVKRYFRPSISGNAVITVISETGEVKDYNLTVSAIQGDISAGILITTVVPGQIYNIEGIIAKGDQLVDHKWVTLTTSVGEFYYRNQPTGSNVFREQTDGNGQIPGGGITNNLEIRVSNYTGFIIVTLHYEEANFKTATTFLCSSSPVGESIHLFPIKILKTNNRVNSLAWSPDGNQLYAGTFAFAAEPKSLYSWNSSDWSQRFLITGLENYTLSSSVKADNSKIVLGENNGDIELYDSNGNHLAGWDHCRDVPGIAWVGDYIFALIEGGGTSPIKNYGLYKYTQNGSYTAIKTFDPSTSSPPKTNLVYHPGKNIIAYAMEYEIGGIDNSVLFIHNASTPSSYSKKILYDWTASHLDISHSGSKIAVVGGAKGVTIIDLNSLNSFSIVEPEKSNVYDVCKYLGSTDYLACGGNGEVKLRIFDATGKIVFDPDLLYDVYSLDFCEANQLLAVGLGNGDIIIYGFDNEGPIISNISVQPSSYSLGTVFSISCDLEDSLSGINESSAKVIIRDSNNTVISQIPLNKETGNIFSCQWDSSGVTTGVYFVGIYVEDKAGNFSELQKAKLLDFTPAPPVAPTLNDCTPLSETEIFVSWTDNSTDEDGFVVERSTNGSTWIEAGTTGENATNFTDSGLTPDCLYYYRIKAFNSNGSSYSNVLTARTLKPKSIKVVKPNGGEQYLRGKLNYIYWVSTGQIDRVKISLLKNDSFYQEITSSTENTGLYLWQIPTDIPLGDDYKIKIEKDDDSSVKDISDSNFSIVNPQGLIVTPLENFASSGQAGGPFNPAEKVYTLNNQSDSPINWSVAKTKDWVSLSANSGTLQAGESTSVIVSINNNANNLPQGNHEDTLSFNNLTTGIGNTTRKVVLTISSTGGAEINIKQGNNDIPDGGNYNFGVKDIGTSTDVIFTIENKGDQDLNLSGNPIISISGQDASQFSVQQQPASLIKPGETTTFIVRFTPSSSGVKVAHISISNNDSDENPYDIYLIGSGGTGALSLVAFPSCGEKGTSVTIKVNIENNLSEISSFGFDLTYDSSKFAWISVVKGNFTQDWATVDGNEISSGVIRIRGFAGSGTVIPPGNTGCIVELVFEVICNNCLNGDESNFCINNYVDDISGYEPQPSCCSFIYTSDKPIIAVFPKKLNFGAIKGSEIIKTSSQYFRIANSGSGLMGWILEENADWLSCSPQFGVEDGKIQLEIDPSNLSPGNYKTSIEISSPGASNSPQYVEVVLRVYSSGEESPPFGVFDIPREGDVVSGNIPVSGWALDDIEVTRVEIKRDSVKEDPSYVIGADGLVYIGDAVFIEGARTDVESIYDEYPLHYRGGWGYMMLTNFLPNKGNGYFKIYAFAYDKEGHRVELGNKTIYCDNAHREKPFGTIDTPPQGGTVSGSNYVNFGWALTPLPKEIPRDGSTIWVWLDGVPLGHPVYNNYRVDIATMFPEYLNSDGAIGYFFLDSTKYENGVHNIAWSVEDNEGKVDGIGSRYFLIDNLSSQGYANISSNINYVPEKSIVFDKSEARIKDFELRIKSIKKGFGFEKEILVNPEISQMKEINLNILEPLKIVFEKPITGIKFLGWGEREGKRLPVGSTLDKENGIFYWMPGPGFKGEYLLHFSITAGKRKVIIPIKVRVSPLLFY